MSDDSGILDDQLLLEICQVSSKDLEATPSLVDELQMVRRLVPPPQAGHDGRLEHAMAMLASALGRMSKHNPVHLPFGYQGPTVTSFGWINRDDLELVGKQIVGLIWTDSKPDHVCSVVGQTISKAVSLGLIKQQEYDAWRPGMASGSGWRSAVAATAYGVAKARSLGEQQASVAAKQTIANAAVKRSSSTMEARQIEPEPSTERDTEQPGQADLPTMPDLPQMPGEERRSSGLIVLLLLAQAYYKLLEGTISMAGWCASVDLELNKSYFWVVQNLTNLLENHEDLRDFPAKFEPLFQDLYPTTIRDVDWDDMVAPEAEGFLSTVQRYVHDKKTTEPEQGSPGWILVQMIRTGVDDAVACAVAYNERMREYAQRAFGGISAGGATQARGEIKAGSDAQSRSVEVEEPPEGTSSIQGQSDPQHQTDDLSQLLDDANFCLMALGDMRRDYNTVTSISHRMEGGGEDWHYADHQDEANYRDAEQRIKSNLHALPGRLAGILDWGLQREMEIFENLDTLTSDRASSGVKADACRDYELGVRAVMNAIIAEQAREQMIDARSGMDSAEDAGHWVFEDLPDGEVRARNRQLCERYASLDSEDLLLLCHQWHQMAIGFTTATKQAGKYHGHVVHDEKVQAVTKILETAIVSRQMDAASRLSRCLRRPDDNHLHHALATLAVLEARLRVETCESGVLEVAEGTGDEIEAPDSQSPASKTTVVKASSKDCYGELDVQSADKGLLRVLFTKNTGGRPTSVCSPIAVEGQLLAILVAGIDTSTRRLREAAAELSGGVLPEDYRTVLEWTQDSLQDHVKGSAAAGRQAINRLRRLVKFQDGGGLVTYQDATGTWKSTIPFRLRTSGQL